MHTSRSKTRPTGAGLLCASTKRKTTVRCAAANDEDLGSLFDSKADSKAEEKRPRTESEANNKAEESKPCAEAGEEQEDAKAEGSSAPSAGKKKEKEFAWMDSESEEGGDDEAAPAATEEAPEEKNEDEEPEVSAETLDEVQSFGRMMLLAPAMQKWLQGGRRGPADIVAACRALARTKFFDSDIIEDIYSVLRKLLRGERLDAAQTHDAIICLKTLNAYEKGVFSAVAKAFKAKTASMDAAMRNTWLEIFRGFGHDLEKDFLQLLEVPPVPPTMPSYRKVRCWHHSRDLCVLDGACTFSHDPRAPLSLGEGGREDWWRSKSVMMTQNQKTLGDGAYGLGPLGQGRLLGSSSAQ
uniref:C3H1-type domain-containing protein n=1 Tax=Alexandrium monilatum TaxID=311494 RepID=A0A7S4VTH4_9DINO|mmetsp:Transcript_53367/g.159274  ORF Transcript_53367/g.159274 Transcript_53367/m.159274 type:complete len:354 (+) Transcript_53367:104-1165(+)